MKIGLKTSFKHRGQKLLKKDKERKEKITLPIPLSPSLISFLSIQLKKCLRLQIT